jgi:hypothetical protein
VPARLPRPPPRPSRRRGAGAPDLAHADAPGPDGLSGCRGSGAPAIVSALMAEMYERVGQVTAGLSALDAALALARKQGTRDYEAEPYRLKRELLLAHTAEHHAEAEACFHQALDVARRQQAKSWELCAAVRLSRLW